MASQNIQSVRFNPTNYAINSPNYQFQENIYSIPQKNYRMTNGNQTGYYPSVNTVFTPNDPLIDTNNYTNQNNTLHNNLKPIIKQENIKEYIINIDSLDRNIKYYPDPFNFKLSTYNNISYNNKNNEKNVDTPFINKIFKNVKYIKVNNLIMPKFYNIIDKGNPNSPEYDSKYNPNSSDYDSTLIDRYEYNTNYYNNTLDRFIVLQLQNIPSVVTYHTHQETNSTGLIFYPKKIWDTFYLAEPIPKYNKIYWTNDSNLLNINDIKFNILDGSYNQLIFSNKDLSQMNNTHIQSPLNKNMQIHITLTIGVVENELSTDITFEQ